MANRFQSFIQRLIGTKKDPGIMKPAGYLSFSDIYKFSQDTTQETLLKSYNSWVYAAISKRADEFSQLKLTLNKIKKVGSDNEIEQVKSHPVLELLDKVNPYLAWPDLLKITQLYKDLAGNAYWWKVKQGNKIVEIWPYLRPDRVSAIPSAVKFIDGYKYLVPDRAEYVRFEADEIIHFQYPNPLDPYCGVSPMQACYLAYNTYIKSSEYNNRFFKNNARADFLLTFPQGLSEDEQKQIRTQWEVRHRGEGHEHRFGILSGDAKLLNVGLSQKDMEFLEQMKFTRDEILAIFKVPKALLDPQELNYASAQVAKEVFLNEVIVPLMKDFVSTLNEFLLPDYGDDSLFFDFENPGEENPTTKFERYRTLIMAGAIAPNEIRENEGLPPFEGGNNIYMPLTQVPVGEEVDINQGKALIGYVKEVKIPKKYNVLIKSKSETAELRAELKIKIAEDLRKSEAFKKKQIILPKERKVKSEKELFNESLWYAKIAKTNEEERKMRKMLSQQFTRQQKQVLKSLREKSFEFNFDINDEAGIFVKLFSPFFKDIVQVFGEDAMDLVDMAGFNLSDRAQDWIKDSVVNFSDEINTTTRDKIKAALVKAVEEGEGIAEAGKRIKSVFTEANTSRANMIARTEIAHASNFASVEAWKQSDVVSGKEWFTALDERVCEICEPMHGKTVALETDYKPGDELFGNVEEPPAHINCRCTVLPVLKTKSLIIAEAKKEAKDEIIKATEEIKQTAAKEIEGVKEIKEKLNKVIEDE